jgi:hypothetical protein
MSAEMPVSPGQSDDGDDVDHRKTELAKKPPHQRAFEVVGAVVLGVLAFGGLLDALANAAAIFSPKVGTTSAVLVVAVWIALEVRLRKRPMRWRIGDGQVVRLKAPGKLVRAGFLSVVALLAYGVVSYTAPLSPASLPVGLELSVGNMHLEDSLPNDVVFAIPKRAYEADFRIASLPLFIASTGARSAERVVVTLRYPSEPELAVLGATRLTTHGVKDSTNSRRRTDSLDAVGFTFLSVDDLNPGTAQNLNEPLKLPAELCGSPRTTATVSVHVSARDFPLRVYSLRLRCLVAGSIEEAQVAQERLLWEEVVKRRQRSGFFAYLAQARHPRAAAVAFILPQFHQVRDRLGRAGYLSDAVHDRFGVSYYNPAPWAYLFAPLRATYSVVTRLRRGATSMIASPFVAARQIQEKPATVTDTGEGRLVCVSHVELGRRNRRR